MPGSYARIAGRKGWLPAEMKLRKRKRRKRHESGVKAAGRRTPLPVLPRNSNEFRNSCAFPCPAVAMIPERALGLGDKRGREREGRDAAQKRRLTLKEKRLDRRAGLERVGQGDGPLLADFVAWKERKKEMRGEGI